jgi:hypothetical protein
MINRVSDESRAIADECLFLARLTSNRLVADLLFKLAEVYASLPEGAEKEAKIIRPNFRAPRSSAISAWLAAAGGCSLAL